MPHASVSLCTKGPREIIEIIDNIEKCVQINLSKKTSESIPLNRFQLFCHIHRNYWQKHFRSILCNMGDHLSERNDGRQENHHNDDRTSFPRRM